MRSVVTKVSPGVLHIAGFVLKQGPNFVDTDKWLKMISSGPHAARLKTLLMSELKVRHRGLTPSDEIHSVQTVKTIQPMQVPAFEEISYEPEIKTQLQAAVKPLETASEPIGVLPKVEENNAVEEASVTNTGDLAATGPEGEMEPEKSVEKIDTISEPAKKQRGRQFKFGSLKTE